MKPLDRLEMKYAEGGKVDQIAQALKSVFHVVDRSGVIQGGPYQSKQQALRGLDRLDNQHGAYIHKIVETKASPPDTDPGLARGGRVSTPHALSAVKRAIGHMERGDHAAAHAELSKSPDAMGHPLVQQAMGLLNKGPSHFDEGGRVTGSSSPGSPGVRGAIKDAVNAARDYFIARPAREIEAARRANEDQVADGTYTGGRQIAQDDDRGYAEGGKVTQVQNMAKFMINKLGIPDADAHRLAREYHAAAGPVSSTAKRMADDLASQAVTGSSAKKSPAQLAQALAAGHVDPKDLQHLLYTDPTLTPLINRYQSGIDNQNLSPEQRQALITKLQSMGGTTPPQMPQPGAVLPSAPPPGPPPQAAPPPQAGPQGSQMPPGGTPMQPPPGALPGSAAGAGQTGGGPGFPQ